MQVSVFMENLKPSSQNWGTQRCCLVLKKYSSVQSHLPILSSQIMSFGHAIGMHLIHFHDHFSEDVQLIAVQPAASL